MATASLSFGPFSEDSRVLRVQQLINHLRLLGLSEKQIAIRAKCNPSHLSHVKHGHRNCSPSLLSRLEAIRTARFSEVARLLLTIAPPPTRLVGVYPPQDDPDFLYRLENSIHHHLIEALVSEGFTLDLPGTADRAMIKVGSVYLLMARELDTALLKAVFENSSLHCSVPDNGERK